MPDDFEDTVLIVRETLAIAYTHWLKHGTPIKVADAPLVTADVIARIGGTHARS